MQKSKKQLLGMGGLALVAASTAYAISIQTPDAGATGGVGGNSQVTVRVHRDDTEVKIDSIKDGQVFTDGVITIEVTYSDADKIEYELYKKNDDGTLTPVDLGPNTPYTPEPGSSGTHSFQFDLNSDPSLGYGDYVLKTTVTSGGSAVEDTVSFSYNGFAPADEGKTDENGDYVIVVDYTADVTEIVVQLYDENGNPIFNPPLVFPVDNPGTAGQMVIHLPLGEYGLSAGEYKIQITAYDVNGNVVGKPIGYKINYKGGGSSTDVANGGDVEVPKTGDITKALNMSRADYLITGLIGFGLFTALALYLLRKHRK